MRQCSVVWSSSSPNPFDLEVFLANRLVISEDAESNPNRPILHFDYQLGRLNEAEWLALNLHFSPEIWTPYNASHEYFLTDFLPVLMRGLVNQKLRDFYESDSPWMNEEDRDLGMTSVATVSNCYTTVWEILRNRGLAWNEQVFHTFWYSRSDSAEYLERATVKISEQEASFGDVLFYYLETGPAERRYRLMLHAAVKVTDQLYFEKPDTDAAYGWRLANREVIDAFIARSVELEESDLVRDSVDSASGLDPWPENKLVVEYRRAKAFAEVQAALPHPAGLVVQEDRLSTDRDRDDRGRIVIGVDQGIGGRDVPGYYRLWAFGVSPQGVVLTSGDRPMGQVTLFPVIPASVPGALSRGLQLDSRAQDPEFAPLLSAVSLIRQ
jgi:hypothetical protein